MTRSGRIAGALIGAALLVLPGLSAQADTTGIGVEIAPSRIEADLPASSFAQSFFITNHESSPRRITMSVSGLGHDLDGTPEFLEPAAATSAIQLDATSFVLAPSERKEVHATGAIPTGSHSLYAAVIAEFAPLQQQTGTVESHSRVASLLLLRGPKPWTESLSVEDVGLLPGPKAGTYNVFAALKNTGNVHVRPTGTAKIIKDGTVLATVALTKQIVIPGFARRIAGVWAPPPAAKGTVRIDVVTSPPGHGTSLLDLSGGSTGGIRPLAKILNLRGHDEGGALVTLTLVNTGAKTISPAVTVIATEGSSERARTILTPGTLEPGKSVDLEWRPGLDDGVFVITAQAKNDGLLLDQASTGLRLGGVVGAAGATRPTSSKSALVALAAALLAMAAAAFFVTADRRRRRVATSRHGTAAA